MIVGMDVVAAGSDMAQLAPMVDQVEQRAGAVPEQWLVDGGFPQWLVDGGFPAHEQIEAVAGKTTLYAPVPKTKPPKSRDPSQDPPAGPAGEAEQKGPPLSPSRVGPSTPRLPASRVGARHGLA